MEHVLESRRFWTAVLDSLVSLALYFSAKYLAPAMADDVKIVIATLQPLFAILILALSVDDLHARNADTQIQLASIKAEAAKYEVDLTHAKGQASALYTSGGTWRPQTGGGVLRSNTNAGTQAPPDSEQLSRVVTEGECVAEPRART